MSSAREVVGDGRRGSMLLLEPCFVIRRKAAAVISALDLADVSEASSVQSAPELMRPLAFDVVVVLGENRLELKLIRDRRAGKTASPAGAKVAFISDPLQADTTAILRHLQVARVAVKPFK